jgi:hypothetical protein
MGAEACEELQERVDQISEDLHNNEEELYQLEAQANEIAAELEEMNNVVYDNYYDESSNYSDTMEYGADELIMELLRRKLEQIVSQLETATAAREFLADELQRALDELCCCERRSWYTP